MTEAKFDGRPLSEPPLSRRQFLAVAAGSAALLLAGCSRPSTVSTAGELREYQGQALGSVADFRENAIKGPQHIDISSYRLRVDGLVASPKEYTYDQVVQRQSFERVLTVNCVEGWSVKVLRQGILLRELLLESQPSPSASVIIFHAYDGYATSFSVDYIMQGDILLNYKINGITLPAERGFPFSLVSEGKWGYKWIRWITEIEFSNDVNYHGYWESRGYSNSGDLNKSFFGP